MLHLLIKKNTGKRCFNAACLLLCAILLSCGFIDLRPVKYSVEPDGFDSILQEKYSPIIIGFDTEMNKKDAESIVQVISDYGTVNGDLSWQGNNLYFIPAAGWTPGIKYSLVLSGTIGAADGRELRLQHFVSFYAVNKEEAPVLEKFYPDGGEAIDINDFYLKLHFSRSMNRLSAESALSISGVSNKIFEWSEDDRVLTVTSDKPLSAWTAYKWSIKDSAKSTDGVPLPKQYSDSFTTDLDQLLPRVINVFPAAFYNGGWSATGADIETGLSLNDGIAVEFNKPMDESVLRSLRFDPSLSGRTEMLDEKTIIYIFTGNPEPETEYTMFVSADTKDTKGLKTGSEFRISFTADIPYLRVLSFFEGINSDSERKFSSDSSGIILPVKPDPAVKQILFTIRFSHPFKAGNTDEQINAAQKIILVPFFPKSLPYAFLEFASWSSDYSIRMRWEGIEPGKEENHFYKLKIPGGKNGITAGGLYMKEDFIIYLEASDE